MPGELPKSDGSHIVATNISHVDDHRNCGLIIKNEDGPGRAHPLPGEGTIRSSAAPEGGSLQEGSPQTDGLGTRRLLLDGGGGRRWWWRSDDAFGCSGRLGLIVRHRTEQPRRCNSVMHNIGTKPRHTTAGGVGWCSGVGWDGVRGWGHRTRAPSPQHIDPKQSTQGPFS
jgi:hypothetical protein